MADAGVAAVPEDELERLLASAGTAVLVGGQALAFWMNHYGVEHADAPQAVVTKDVDFLGKRDDVERLAAAVGGSVEFPKTMSILCGVVRKKLTSGKLYEVDVLSRINGVSDKELRRDAVERALANGTRFFVMSPIDCLVTRVANLHKIQDKRSPAGIWQTRKAIEVCRHHIEDMLSKGAEKAAIRAATTVLSAATATMGIKAYENYGIDILDAVPVESYTNANFIEQQWPRSVARINKVRDTSG